MENWIASLLSFVGGSVMATLINHFLQKRSKRKKEPIALNVEIKTIFDNLSFIDDKTNIIIRRNENDITLNNLFLASVNIFNKGIVDFEKFPVKITIKNNGNIVHFIEQKTEDPSHIIKYTENPSFENPVNQLEIKLTPFNKNDLYSFDIYYTFNSKPDEKGVSISTTKPVKFIDYTNIVAYYPDEK